MMFEVKKYHLEAYSGQKLQAIKGLPSTTIIQVDQSGVIEYPHMLSENNLILNESGTSFSLYSSVILQPYTIIERQITHQPNRCCISIKFKY